MKKSIATILIGLFSTIVADPTPDAPVDAASKLIIGEAVSDATSDLRFSIKSLSEEAQVSKPAFFYVRFAAAESDVARMSSLLPGLGIGYRRLAGNGAADISISGIGYGEKKNGQIFWTVPKTSYLHYFDPDQQHSLYMGGGLAWGGLMSKENQKENHFIGIIPSFTSGYEFVRKSTVLGFTELNISQPALAVYKKGAFPGPIAELTLGIGF
jgi:hypothetical protein